LDSAEATLEEMRKRGSVLVEKYGSTL